MKRSHVIRSFAPWSQLVRFILSRKRVLPFRKEKFVTHAQKMFHVSYENEFSVMFMQNSLYFCIYGFVSAFLIGIFCINVSLFSVRMKQNETF